MPHSPLPIEIREFLALPNPAVMGTYARTASPSPSRRGTCWMVKNYC